MGFLDFLITLFLAGVWTVLIVVVVAIIIDVADGL